MKRWLRMVLGMAVLSLCALLLPAANASAAETLKIGSIMPISGPLSVVGMSWTRGFAMGVDFVNENGGITINGQQYKLQLISEDTQGSAEGARASALKLVHQDGVKFIVGGILEPAIEAINGVCERSGVLFAATNANIPGHPADVSPDKPLQVRFAPNHDDNHEANLQYLKKHYPEARKIALSAPNIGYETMIERLEKQLAQHGFELVRKEIWQWGTTDFLPVMTRLLASRPDVIFAMVSGQAQYQLSAARQMGFKGPFISNSPLAPEVFLAVAGAAACDKLIVNQVNTFQPNDKVREIMDRWGKKYREPPVMDGVMGYDTIWLLAQAIEKAQSLDAKAVVATLESLTTVGDLVTSYGASRMGGKERFGVDRVLYRPTVITHLEKGKVVDTVYYPPK